MTWSQQPRRLAWGRIEAGPHRVARPRFADQLPDLFAQGAADPNGLIVVGAGLLVGRDRGLPVSADYRPPFPFTGRLDRVELRSGRPTAGPDDDTRLRAAVSGD